MSFETLILEPVVGNMDVVAVREWLETAPFADPTELDTWLLCATPRLAVLARLDREEGNTDHLLAGVRVWVEPARVGVSAYANMGAMARARNFVRWLLRSGSMTNSTGPMTGLPGR